MITIPEKCRFIFEKLENAGFECYAVGGCVRDSIMGITPKDWDFTTNATPDEITEVFCDYKLVDIGKKFGTICVIVSEETFEITTYRIERGYSDNRHPDTVLFSSMINDDLSRRDFTMNSIAFSEKYGIVDPFGGVEDIHNRVIRCTGEPSLRFSEDALRILRAIRFASVLGFNIEKTTSEALFMCKDNLTSVNPNRMQKELTSLLCGMNVQSVLSNYAPVLSVIIPEIEPMLECVQNNPHHKYDVWNHTLKAMSLSEPDERIRLALFFHDSGKPFVKTTDDNGIDHFKKHQIKSAEIASDVLKRFCYSSSLINDVVCLVRYHDERFYKMGESIKNLISIIGEQLIYTVIYISQCDILAQSNYKQEYKLSHLDNVKKETDRIISMGECYSLSQLSLNGDDLKAVGFVGKEIGTALESVLKKVIKGKLSNEKTQLLQYVYDNKQMLLTIDK